MHRALRALRFRARAATTAAAVAAGCGLVAGPTAQDATAHAPVASASDVSTMITEAFGKPRKTLRTSSVRSARSTAGLPQEWCGTRRAVDATEASGTPDVKVLYAYPADGRDRSPFVSTLLQRSAALIGPFLAREAASRKTIRFDMGSSCGADYLDIRVLRLPRRAAEYATGAAVRTDLLKQDIRAVVDGGRRNFVVFVDGISASTFGMAEGALHDKRPGPENANNAGGKLALLLGDRRQGEKLSGYSEIPQLMLHEVSHTLGAVVGAAPNASDWGHCNQTRDVMCAAPQVAAASIAADCRQTDADFEPYDCGRDDYFNPDPPAGSYLAAHWNVYNSVFLADCSERPRACGSARATAVKKRSAGKAASKRKPKRRRARG